MRASDRKLSDVPMLIEGSMIDSPVKPKWNESADEWLERSAKVTQTKRDILAEAFANGQARTPAQIRKLAKLIGHSEREIRMWKADSRFNAMITERLRTRALHAACEALDSQAEKAHEDTNAFAHILKVAEIIKPTGPLVQTNTVIDQRRVGDTDSDKAFFQQFRNRVEKRLAIGSEDAT